MACSAWPILKVWAISTPIARKPHAALTAARAFRDHSQAFVNLYLSAAHPPHPERSAPPASRTPGRAPSPPAGRGRVSPAPFPPPSSQSPTAKPPIPDSPADGLCERRHRAANRSNTPPPWANERRNQRENYGNLTRENRSNESPSTARSLDLCPNSLQYPARMFFSPGAPHE
jgi:hypothetical protein